MTERSRRQGSEPLSRLRKLGLAFFDTKTSHPLIDKLDLRSPKRRLNAFLGVQTDQIGSLTPLNKILNGVGDNIQMLIEQRGKEKQLGGNPVRALELQLEDGTIRAYYGVVPGLISVHRSFLGEGTSQIGYNVYLPTEGRQLTSIHTERKGQSWYFARDERSGSHFAPEHNSHDRGNIQGYLQLTQQATRDLLQATHLLAA